MSVFRSACSHKILKEIKISIEIGIPRIHEPTIRALNLN